MGSTKRRLPRDWAPSRLVCTECNALLGVHRDDLPLVELISAVRNRLYTSGSPVLSRGSWV